MKTPTVFTVMAAHQGDLMQWSRVGNPAYETRSYQVQGVRAMEEYREVSLEERQRMMESGVFDINGNISAHPGYTGIHKRKDGTYWFRGQEITDASDIYAIEHRNDNAHE